MSLPPRCFSRLGNFQLLRNLVCLLWARSSNLFLSIASHIRHRFPNTLLSYLCHQSLYYSVLCWPTRDVCASTLSPSLTRFPQLFRFFRSSLVYFWVTGKVALSSYQSAVGSVSSSASIFSSSLAFIPLSVCPSSSASPSSSRSSVPITLFAWFLILISSS